MEISEKTMGGFKLLAIRPLNGCDENFSKRLKLGTIYKFYQNYIFRDRKNREICAKNKNLNESVHSVDPFTDLNIYTRKESLKINISAVVGKNGSGKSTLFELFFLIVFLKSAESNLLDLDGEIIRIQDNIKLIETDIKIVEENILSYFDDRNPDDVKTLIVNCEGLKSDLRDEKYYLASLENAKSFSGNNSVAVEIYFEVNERISRIAIYNESNVSNEISLINEVGLTKENIKDIFYSISLNYSLYGLNSRYMGKWIERLFHKNDAYYTPIVINPMRSDGDININVENDLAQSRILTNLVDDKLKQKEIVKGKVVESIQFSIPTRKLDKNKYYISRGAHALYPDKNEGILKIVKVPNDYSDHRDIPSDDSILPHFGIEKIAIVHGGLKVDMVEKYIYQKLFKTARTYPEYRRFLQDYDSNKQVISDVDGFISSIKKDSTHKTLKLRQFINVLKYGILYNKESEQMDFLNKTRKESAITWSNGVFQMNFRNYAKIINNAYERAVKEDPSKKHDLIEFVPNAFFVPQVRFKGEGRFESLSSGEQQYYNAINTIVYHILNLDSISNHYTRVNILFDEVELYFHPEFQRTFISDLLRSLNNLKLDKIKEVNILFSTHSPFILSDLPSSNILRLKNGEPQSNSKQTFAANIYDLLKDDFFLENGVIGEFAKEKIQKVLESNSDHFEENLKIIDLIGDPLLKGVVSEKFNNNIQKEELLNIQIEKLTNQRNKIRNASNRGI